VVNKEPLYKAIGYFYQCPACHASQGVEADDSFLKALVSEEQLGDILSMRDIQKENDALRPLKAFQGVHCEVCGQAIMDWTKDSVERAATGWGWGHATCWRTPAGQVIQSTRLAAKMAVVMWGH